MVILPEWFVNQVTAMLWTGAGLMWLLFLLIIANSILDVLIARDERRSRK